MEYFLRFTDDIERDLENGYSYHFSGMDKEDFQTAGEFASAYGIDEDKVDYINNQWSTRLVGLCGFKIEERWFEDEEISDENAIKIVKDMDEKRKFEPYHGIEGFGVVLKAQEVVDSDDECEGSFFFAGSAEIIHKF